jgi:hypothetical protein
VAIPANVRLVGEKAAVAVTLTGWVAGVKPGADAVIFAEPRLTPLTWGCVAGVVALARMKTLVGAMVTLVASLEDSVTVVPPAGAGADKLTCNGADWPSPTFALVGRMTCPKLWTITRALVSRIFGRALAWMSAEPVATPVTVTVALVAFAGMVTVGGTVATLVLSELRLTVRPPAGADPGDRFSVKFAVVLAGIVWVPGEKLRDAVTFTCEVPLA